MMYITLMNEGEQVEITIGGKRMVVKSGKNWFIKGTAEFITSKVGQTSMLGNAVECDDEGTPIDEIQQGIKHIVTQEEIKENNLQEQLKEGDEIIIPPVIVLHEVKITEEDKKKYEDELKTFDRIKLIEIAKFKEIVFAKNSSDEKLIKLIINSLK